MSDGVPESVHITVGHLDGENTQQDYAAPTGVLVVNHMGEVIQTEISDNSQGTPVRVLAIGNGFVLTEVKGSETENLGSTTVVADPSHDAKIKENVEESAAKRRKLNYEIKNQFAAIEQEILLRLELVSEKLETVGAHYKGLEEKLKKITTEVKNGCLATYKAFSPTIKGRTGTIVVGIPPKSSLGGDAPGIKAGEVQLFSLNTETDYPNGSWLGDPDNPEMRVRVPIVPSDLEQLNKTCSTPEKMALTLLDYLFDRETQAVSNISGSGKHGKKQLDPLKVYGIKSHLLYKFLITEKDWHRIKQNLDSKCRTAFRRGQKGMPLTVKAFRDRLPATYVQLMNHSDDLSSPECSLNASQSDISMDNDLDMSSAIPVAIHSADGVTLPLQQITGKPQVIHTEHGDIQIVHATPEQIAQIQQSHQIQVLTSSEVLELQTPSTLASHS